MTEIDKSQAVASGDNIALRFAATGIGLGIASIIGVFTALGIQGELFSRMLRNAPTATSIAFAFALAGVVAGLIALFLGTTKYSRIGLRIVAIGGTLLLLVGAITAVWVGVNAFGVRDHPTLKIVPLAIGSVPETPTQGEVRLRVTASGSFLEANDRMLLRVGAFPDGTNTQDAWNRCASTPPNGISALEDGSVLAIAESGASIEGATTNTVTVRISTGQYRYVCAHAVLSANANDRDTWRYSTSLFDLQAADANEGATDDAVSDQAAG